MLSERRPGPAPFHRLQRERAAPPLLGQATLCQHTMDSGAGGGGDDVAASTRRVGGSRAGHVSVESRAAFSVTAAAAPTSDPSRATVSASRELPQLRPLVSVNWIWMEQMFDCQLCFFSYSFF